VNKHGEKKHRAIFLDRDGTINVDNGYLSCCEDFCFLPGVLRALKRLQRAGYLLVVVTNQSGVARGYFSMNCATQINEHMNRLLLEEGINLAGIYMCPHHPEGESGNFYSCRCRCRKGQPGMLLQAAGELDIDLSRSWMVGDKHSDIEAGYRAGCQSSLLILEYERQKKMTTPQYCDGIFSNLADFADFLLQ